MTIGDDVTIGVTIGGGFTIGDGVTIGGGVTTNDGVTIGGGILRGYWETSIEQSNGFI